METIRNRVYDILRKSESLFKTDMVYVAKGGIWLTFGQGISILTSFLLAIAFANLITPEQFGTYKYILSLGAFVGIFTLSGLPSALARSVSRQKEGTFIESFFIALRWGLIVAAISGCLAIYYFLNGNTTLGFGMLIIGALSPLLDSGELYNAYLNGKASFKFSGLFGALRSLITGTSIFIGLLFFDNLIYLVAIYFFSHTITVLALFVLTLRLLPPNNEKDPEIYRLGKHTSLLHIFSNVADRIDNILLFHYFGPVQLAIYNFALALPNNILGLLKNIVALAVPKFAKQDFTKIKETLVRKSFSLLFVTLPITIIYILLAPYLFKIFFPQYLDAVIYTQVFSLVILMSGVLPIAALDAQMAIKQKYILNVSTNTIKLILVFVGIYFFGIWGAIVARIISKGVGLALGYTLIYFST